MREQRAMLGLDKRLHAELRRKAEEEQRTVRLVTERLIRRGMEEEKKQAERQ
jgi:hypothetical protein